MPRAVEGRLRFLCVFWVLFSEPASPVGTSTASLMPHVGFGLVTTEFTRQSNAVSQKSIPNILPFLQYPPSPPSTSPPAPVSPTLFHWSRCPALKILLWFFPGHGSPTWSPICTSWALSLSWVAGLPPPSADILHLRAKSTVSSYWPSPLQLWPGTWKSRRKSASVSWTPLKCPENPHTGPDPPLFPIRNKTSLMPPNTLPFYVFQSLIVTECYFVLSPLLLKQEP